MDQPIARRDFLQGTAVAVAGAAAVASGCAPLPPSAPRPGPVGAPAPAGLDPATYPPLRSGLRGSHAGSFEIAHELARDGRTEWPAAVEPDSHVYDLVVVGGGVSGLSAAIFYREHHPDSRILILENHDDFGGHAKRNEFHLDGRMILGYGGSQSLENPSDYSRVSQRLLRRIGVRQNRFEQAYDQHFYKRNGLAPALYFDKATYGMDRLVRTDLFDPSYFIPAARANVPMADAVAQMPLSDDAKGELLRLATLSEDQLRDLGVFGEVELMQRISYQELLTSHLGVRNQEVIDLLRDVPSGYAGYGIDALPALDGLLFGLPGLGGTSLGGYRAWIARLIRWATEPYIYHWPDGNASIARLMVQHLMPHAIHDDRRGSIMEGIVTAQVGYAQLDRADAPVRIRLNSTVVHVSHDGAPAMAAQVHVTYARGDRMETVRARHCVLACYNMTIPFLCPTLPQQQKDALRELVKIPLVYTNVLLRRWSAVKRAGIAMAHCPGSWHRLMLVDFPVSMQGYRFTSHTEQPLVLHLSRVPTAPGAPPRDQFRIGRHELLNTPFETIEREIRTQLTGMLGGEGFDSAADIAGITVNRWPHGYAYDFASVYDDDYPPGEAPHEIGRRPFGRIAIANSDAGASAYVDSAIDQAWRAVGELTA